MPQAHFPRSPLQIGDMDFVDSGLLGQVNLSPAALLAKLADAFSELDADIVSFRQACVIYPLHS